MTSRRPRWPRGLLVPVAVIVCWQLLKSAGVLDYEYLPSPRHVFDALVDLVRSGELMRDLRHTLCAAALAATIAMILGGALGFVVGLNSTIRRYVMASIDFLRTVPAVALVPVAVLSLGPAASTEVLLAASAALWPVVLHTAASVASVHPRLYDVANMLQLGPATTFRKIVLPAAVPGWLVGAQIAAVISLLVAVLAEIVMYPRGLGGGLIESMHALAPARMWAYALVCGLVGILLNAVLRHAVRLSLPGNSMGVAQGSDIAAPTVTAMRGLLPIGVFLVCWQLSASDDSLSFPPPSEWLRAIGLLHDDGQLMPAALQTFCTYAFGLILAILIGTVLGIVIGSSSAVDQSLTPTIVFIAAIPGAALVPVTVLLFGPGLLSGIVAVGLIVSWPILLNTAATMRSLPAVRLELSRTLGLSPGQRWIKVILPSLTPGIMLGVRVASSMAIIITLLVDIIGAGAGIGRLLVERQQHFEAAAAWGLLLIVGCFGYLMSLLLAWLADRIGAHGLRENRFPGQFIADRRPHMRAS